MVMDMIHCMMAEKFPALLGIFIEDSGLLEHARSRLSREVLHSGATRPLESVALSRQIRAQSKQVRMDFEAAAANLGLPHTFEFTQGAFFDEIAMRVEGAESLVVALAADSIAVRRAWQAASEALSHASLQTLLLAREGWSKGTNVLVIVDELATAEVVLTVAGRLAEQSKSPMSLILTGQAGEHPEEIRNLLAGLNAIKNVPVQIAAGDALHADALVETIKRTHARMVALPWNQAIRDVTLIETLLNKSSSPVLLVK